MWGSLKELWVLRSLNLLKKLRKEHSWLKPAPLWTPNCSSCSTAPPIAHVATVLPDGAPHSVPVWIGTHEGSAVIITGPGSQKARNLRRDPRIAISLTPPDNPFVPVVLRGRIR